MNAPAPQPARPELTDAAVVSRSWGMALATLISRITGFVRIVLLAAILGAALSSAFSVANQLPNQIAALVLEATFTAIFVPVLARAERDDPDGGAAFVRRLVTLATALLLATTVISVAAAPLLVSLMLGGDPQVNQPLTTAFAYLLLPQVICYGLSSVFMAILNTRNIFGAPAWAPVVNNVVAIATLVVYLLVPGELAVDPVRMGNAKLLVLGVGTTAGVVAQTAVLLVAIRRERISLRPLWGIDDRLKRFGAMAAAMVLYVLISQIGLVVTNQIAATSAASGPAIYYYAWLLLQLPFGMIGVTVLTVVMPRLSRNAAAGDDPAVLADLSLATRLMMITLIPIVALMTVGGPAIGSALFAYGNFGDVDAGYLGAAVTMSAFTLIPYALVLLQLRVFYAREQPWIPIAMIVVITTVKIVASVAAPHLTDNPELVAAYLGLANGVGFFAGAAVGHVLLRRALRPVTGHLLGPEVVRTVLVTVTASLLAGLVAEVLDRVLGLRGLTDHGAAGSMLRLVVLAAVMLPIIAAVMVRARVPEAEAALAAVRRRLGAQRLDISASNRPSRDPRVPYAEHNHLPTPGGDVTNASARRMPPEHVAGGWTPKGTEVANKPSEGPGAGAASRSVAPPQTPRPAGGPATPEPAVDAQAGDPLTPGLSIAGGRYRLLVRHGGTAVLQFWQALDTALERQVALTFVDPGQTMAEEQLAGVLSRTQRLSQIDLPGIARVLDVVRIGTGGLVVSEWVRGASLQEVAGTAPSPIGAARAMRALATAAEAAHHTGVALSIDHPARVRVSIDGDVTLAFPATLPESKPEDDIRGIGATLYALLVNRWPLDSGAGCGIAPADRDAAGNPVNPDAVNPEIPFQISAAASHAIQPDGGIRGASTLSNLLQQATALHEQTELLGPIDDEPPAPRREPPPLDAEKRAERRRRVLIGAGIGGAVILVALLVLASVLNRIFGDVNGLDKTELGLSSPSVSSSRSGSASPGSTVKPVQATVFSPGGEADRPQDAGLAIDGNPATFWSTDTYSDPVPFPNFKSGVGLVLQLPKPTVIGSVGINVSSTGTKVELRSASTPKPTRLEDTTLLAPAKALQPGANKISVDSSSPTSNLLIWITTMGSTGGESRTQISEITVQAAS
ncbi:murein biosynthesis integral membrane protein MurJ [Mycolicibacter sinensis]|uniref:Murein biosynthesis integral membrane protein MurJ n=1 Tax=Mycolicibacter sinensis (strain JDM601) TaxID=875328 RepID=A0A1A2XMP5_MYCSD|nr:murein biosynthesis integral membrane protein MurJ [Mycolicibacter sinensis]OBH19411.1 murein biosynthesis integral membrane protein MurJ [Mycolicibacter sinensis]OBI26327.1 murein biosynthesis integral membrane protein MurJ [Mycolicibacter sinensis]